MSERIIDIFAAGVFIVTLVAIARADIDWPRVLHFFRWLMEGAW